jgi:cytidine deaminase
MSLNPFAADPTVPARLAALPDEKRAAVQTLVTQATAGVIPAAAVAATGVDVRDAMRLLVEPARAFARPPISGFLVGAVGLERDTGNLILGGNLEFPGTHLGLTVHGEGFVATRAFHRGTALSAIAIGEAHPCAHCRQYLSEFAWASDLDLIDPLGHTLRLSQLYPWPFDPAYLGQDGALPGRERTLAFVDAGPPELLAAGRRAHAPYSNCPGAVLLTLSDGTTLTGSAIESVAFNPTMQPAMAALIELAALGRDHGDIRAIWLGTVRGGAVDYTASTIELMARIAPGVPVTVADWR